MEKTIGTKIELVQTREKRTDDLLKYWRGKKIEGIRLNTFLCMSNSIGGDNLDDCMELDKLYDSRRIAERCDEFNATMAGK